VARTAFCRHGAPHATRTRGHVTALRRAMAGDAPRPEDDPLSDGETTESDSADESLPARPLAGRRRPGESAPILTRLAVSRNPSPLAAATAAPGVCLLRFAWESAAGSLVGAVVGYGKATPRASPSVLFPLFPVRVEPRVRVQDSVVCGPGAILREMRLLSRRIRVGLLQFKPQN
jgi:hypothetical protein